MKYGVIVTARNEQDFIGDCIDSVLSQTIKPTFFIVIDDNSSDMTKEITRRRGVLVHTVKHDRSKIRGVNISKALSVGIIALYQHCPNFDFLLTIDSDTRIPKNYVEFLYAQWARPNTRRNKIELVSGIPREKVVSRSHVTNGARLYSRKAVDVFFPFPCRQGFDSYILYKIQANGMHAREYRIRYEDIRPYNVKYVYRWFLVGRCRYLQGFPFDWMILCFPRYSRFEPAFLGYQIMLWSWICHRFTGWRENEPVITFVNSWLKRQSAIKVRSALVKPFKILGIKEKIKDYLKYKPSL